MTDDERTFLHSIAADAADDLPRLVYADWLEEHDQQVRAEFIRAQIDVAKLERGPRAAMNRHVDVWKRQQELLDGHLPELLGPLAGLWSGQPPIFERGFLKRVELDWGTFRHFAAELVRLVPVPEVAVIRVGYDHFDNWRNLPDRSQALVTKLEFADGGHYPDSTDTGLAPWWRRLTRLQVLKCAEAFDGDADLEAVPWADLPELRDLDLSNCNLSDAGVIHLIDTGLLLRLERLILGYNPLGDQSAFELADRVGRSRVLKHLNLRYTNISSAGQAAITAAFGGRVDLF